MMWTTTFRKLHEARVFSEKYHILAEHLGGARKYGQDTPIPITTILDCPGLGFLNALWALETVNDERGIRLLACDFAEYVLPVYERRFPDDNRPRQAIETARRFAHGTASGQELHDACDACADACADAYVAAYFAAADAARAAAYAAADAAPYAAAYAAADAARAANASDVARKWQAERLRAYAEGKDNEEKG